MMLGSTASGIYWTFRYLERAENTARLLEAGLRLTLTRSGSTSSEWNSVLTTIGAAGAFGDAYESADQASVVDFVLRDKTNPSSVLSIVLAARSAARSVRTALTREVWEALNEAYLVLSEALAAPVDQAHVPELLRTIRQEAMLVSGALHSTMLRDEAFDFAQLGTHLERADSTTRILDVKYYLLLPSTAHVGSALDAVQWQNILRSVSAERAARWTYSRGISPRDIAEFLILDERMPRSLSFCTTRIQESLASTRSGNPEMESHLIANELQSSCLNRSIESVFDEGLHEFLQSCLSTIGMLSTQIDADYRFTK